MTWGNGVTTTTTFVIAIKPKASKKIFEKNKYNAIDEHGICKSCFSICVPPKNVQTSTPPTP